MVLGEIVTIVILAAIVEELILGFSLGKYGRRLIDWIVANLTWQDIFVWINPVFFFVSHILVYGITIDNIILSGTYSLQLHIISQVIVLFQAKKNFERNLPMIRKRIKEKTIVVGDPDYSSMEWMLCNQ